VLAAVIVHQNIHVVPLAGTVILYVFAVGEYDEMLHPVP